MAAQSRQLPRGCACAISGGRAGAIRDQGAHAWHAADGGSEVQRGCIGCVPWIHRYACIEQLASAPLLAGCKSGGWVGTGGVNTAASCAKGCTALQAERCTGEEQQQCHGHSRCEPTCCAAVEWGPLLRVSRRLVHAATEQHCRGGAAER